ncbi:MAG: rhamnulokinase [Ruminococcaceae bacterium]|nr:rhamnulokinase [Oscillospiraceae bacterium]
MSYFLAIDIGASSGRHILGEYVCGEIKMTEIYRFENGIKDIDGTLCWDVQYLTKAVLDGIKECGRIGKIPKTVAIDTWGVDYVLLDKEEKEILPAVSYRDARTEGIPNEVDKLISQEELYGRTGIQRQNYNTIYQLFCDVKSGKIDKAEHLLMMPEYLSYKLTGVMKSEYTISSTTSLLNAEKRDWDMEIIERLGIKKSIFKTISVPGSVVGKFSEETKEYVGFDATVVFAPAHDTASAVAACNLKEHGMYISSGTWSLVGVQNTYPVLSDEAFYANFANEGGVNNTYRFLKNIMGMWLFQSIRKNLDKKYTYDEMMEMAKKSKYTKTFAPNDPRLLAPSNMIDAVKECLNEPDLPLCDVINSVYHSLASSYADIACEIEKITGEKINCINIVGGGSKDTYLNELTGKYTGREIITGPVEATAMGNLKIQMKIKDEI